MKTITTYNGITLLIVEIHHNTENLQIVSDSLLGDIPTGIVSYLSKDNLGKDYEIIGTTSTLTNEQVELFVEDCPYYAKYWKKYQTKENDNLLKNTCYTPLESFNSLLEANNIDLTKEYVVLQIKND